MSQQLEQHLRKQFAPQNKVKYQKMPPGIVARFFNCRIGCSARNSDSGRRQVFLAAQCMEIYVLGAILHLNLRLSPHLPGFHKNTGAWHNLLLHQRNILTTQKNRITCSRVHTIQVQWRECSPKHNPSFTLGVAHRMRRDCW